MCLQCHKNGFEEILMLHQRVLQSSDASKTLGRACNQVTAVAAAATERRLRHKKGVTWRDEPWLLEIVFDWFPCALCGLNKSSAHLATMDRSILICMCLHQGCCRSSSSKRFERATSHVGSIPSCSLITLQPLRCCTCTWCFLFRPH